MWLAFLIHVLSLASYVACWQVEHGGSTVDMHMLVNPIPYEFPPMEETDSPSLFPTQDCNGNVVEEETIDELQKVMVDGRLTSLQLVECCVLRHEQVNGYIKCVEHLLPLAEWSRAQFDKMIAPFLNSIQTIAQLQSLWMMKDRMARFEVHCMVRGLCKAKGNMLITVRNSISGQRQHRNERQDGDDCRKLGVGRVGCSARCFCGDQIERGWSVIAWESHT